MAKKEVGEFGTIYTQFKNRPKEAIKHLKKVKEGECVNALYRKEIGYVDIIWGVPGTKKNDYLDGFGLAHIIAKHGKELKQLGFEVEDFIPIVFAFGKISINTNTCKIFLDGETFRLIIKTTWNEAPKRYVLTAYDLRPITNKRKK